MSAPIYKKEILPGTDGVPGTILHVAQQKGALHVWYLADGGWTDIEVVPTGGVPTYPNYSGNAHDVDDWIVSQLPYQLLVATTEEGGSDA